MWLNENIKSTKKERTPLRYVILKLWETDESFTQHNGWYLAGNGAGLVSLLQCLIILETAGETHLPLWTSCFSTAHPWQLTFFLLVDEHYSLNQSQGHPSCKPGRKLFPSFIFCAWVASYSTILLLFCTSLRSHCILMELEGATKSTSVLLIIQMRKIT